MPPGRRTTSEHALRTLVLKMYKVTASRLKDRPTKATVVDHHFRPLVTHLPRVILLPASTRLPRAVWCMHKAMVPCPITLNTRTRRTGTSNRVSQSTRTKAKHITHNVDLAMSICMLYLFPLHALHDEQQHQDTPGGSGGTVIEYTHRMDSWHWS